MRIYINGCRYHERLNVKKEGSKLLTYTGSRVEIIVILVTGPVVTPEARGMVRRERNQRT